MANAPKAKFAPGETVTLTNDYGVIFPGKTILEFRQTDYGPAYLIDPTDTPWFAVPERNLALAQAPAQARGDHNARQ